MIIKYLKPYIFIILFLSFYSLSCAYDDSSDYVQGLIDSKDIVELPPGKLVFYKPVYIKRSNITIKGNNTHIISYIKSPYSSVFIISGDSGLTIGKVKADVQTGSVYIPVNFVKPLKSNYIWIGSKNTDYFLKSIGTLKWNKEFPYIRQDILQVDSIYSDYIKLKNPVEFPIDKDSVIKEPKFVENIVIQDITIEQMIPGHSKEEVNYVYENLFPDYSVDSIYVSWARNVFLDNITVLMAGRHPINLEDSLNIYIKNLKVYGSWNKGKEGNGYVRFSKTYDSIIENCYIEGIRHVVFQWSSSRNKIKNCMVKVDINFHGGYERYNKVIDSIVEIPPQHPWSGVEYAPYDAHWAPPSGPGNELVNTTVKILR